MGPAASAIRVTGTGIALRVRLTPKAARDAIGDIEPTADGPAVKARVRAAPEDGAANAALERLIAGWLGVPKSDVGLVSGHKSRIKTIAVQGSPDALSRLAEMRLAETRPAETRPAAAKGQE